MTGTRITFLENCGFAKKGETHLFYDPIHVSELIATGKAELAVKKEVLKNLVALISKKGQGHVE